jgi:pimeloyl-ACP methyl ester carboxylesterase
VGLSTAGTGAHDLPSLADDAASLLDHLRWPDAHIVGVSMGGMVAQHLALNRRERVRSLTLIATHPGGLRALPKPEGLLRFVQANTRKGPARMEALSKLLFSPRHREVLLREGWTPQELAQFAVASNPAVRLQQLLGILKHDTRDRLHELAGLPVLVVRPGEDHLVNPWGSEELLRRVPGAKILDLPEAYHAANAEEAAAVNAAIRELVRHAEAQRAG